MALDCDEVNTDVETESYLRVDYSISCDWQVDGRRPLWLAYTVVLLLLWPVGVPAYFAYLFHRNRVGCRIIQHSYERYEKRLIAHAHGLEQKRIETRHDSERTEGSSGAADAHMKKGRSVEHIDRLLRHGQPWQPSDAPSSRLRLYEHDLLVGVRDGALRLRDAAWIKARSKQYELSVVWFDVAEYARKVLVSAATMLMPQGSAVQLIFSLLLSVTFLLLLVRLAPYKRDADDVLAIVCQARAGAAMRG